MKSIFDDLDQLIEQAVAKATETEKSLQRKQEKAVEKKGLRAEDTQETDEVDEAEDDEPKEKDSSKDDEDTEGKTPDDESVDKITGDKEKEGGKPASKRKTGDDAPGTKTSKKLADPSEKTISNPKFDDIGNKVNALRGSGSLRDEKVSSAVKAYLGTLKPAEKSALLTYLTNLSQIMAMVKSPKDVKDPSEIGIKTTYKKKSKGLEKEKQPKSDEKSQDIVVVGGK